MSQNTVDDEIRTTLLVQFLYAADFKPVKIRHIAYFLSTDVDSLERWMRCNGSGRLWIECKEKLTWKLRCGMVPIEAVET